jgi:hypothetical protein
MEKFSSQLMQRLPSGMSHSEAELLCFWLFLTAGDIPEVFHPQLTCHGLADMFAELARSGWIRPGTVPLPIVESSYWDGVISSRLQKKNPDIVELARGRELVKRFGFCGETPSA